jgi:triosephosphate isomerase
MRKKIVAGNWKMNKSFLEGVELAKEITAKMPKLKEKQEVIVIPPFIHLSELKKENGEVAFSLGAQNCHHEEKGAYTGEISAAMLSSLGVNYCLVGHSERRLYNAETNVVLKEKVQRLIENAVHPIFCCGEQLEERKSGDYFKVVEEQLSILWNFGEELLKKVIIAYEPVWAIGTGETASSEQVQEMHSFIRKLIEEKKSTSLANSTTILYGGSCKPENAAELFSKEDVDGGLIGGASLNADDFLAIIKALN